VEEEPLALTTAELDQIGVVRSEELSRVYKPFMTFG
jgi:hypothetical protein